MASPPRFPLFDAPSPLHALPRFSAALGGRVEIWTKREDLLPLAFGGNKLRNLEFLIGAALADGCDTLVTSGRRWSNHARLTAAAGARAGLGVHLVLSGPQVDPPGPGIRIARSFGATMHLLDGADRDGREAAVARVAREVRARRAPVRDRCRRLGLDRSVRADAGRPRARRTGGGGGTHHRPRRAADCDRRDPGRPARRPAALDRGDGRRRRAVGGGSTAVDRGDGRRTGRGADAGAIDLDETHIGDGYGRPTAEAAEAAAILGRTEAILVDPIYTAKALAGLIAGVRSGAWDGERVVFWHAGGLPGLFEPLD